MMKFHLIRNNKIAEKVAVEMNSFIKQINAGFMGLFVCFFLFQTDNLMRRWNWENKRKFCSKKNASAIR